MGSTLQLTLLSGAIALTAFASGCASHHPAEVVIRRQPVRIDCDYAPLLGSSRVCDCYPSAATCFCTVQARCSCPRVVHYRHGLEHSLGVQGTRAVIQNRHRIGKEVRRSGRKINVQGQRFSRQTQKEAGRVGRKIASGGHRANREVKRTTHRAGRQVKRSSSQVSSETRRAGRRTGKELKRAGKSIGKFFKKIF